MVAASVVSKPERAPPLLMAGRLTLLALALCAASFLNEFSSDNDVETWVFVALGTLFAANLLVVLWFRMSPNSVWLRRVQSGLDVGIVTGIIWSTGGLSSPYHFLYLPVLFLARISGSLRNTIFTALLAILGYAAVTYAGHAEILTSPQLLKGFATQLVILSASMSLVIFCAQYLISTIRNRDALVAKSKLDLHDLTRGQIQLLEKLPYGVISLAKDLTILRANKRAATLLEQNSDSLANMSLARALSNFSKTHISISREAEKLQLSGLPKDCFQYDFIEAGPEQDQRFFVFQPSEATMPLEHPRLLDLEGRLRQLLSDDSDNDAQQYGVSSSFMAESVVMQKVFSLIERAAPSDATVLIQGESGTGKELVAKALHDNSPRAANAFVTVNCGAIPENLIESTLFGHKRGAYTGAVSDSVGLIREAEGGTLFLDEIGELPLHMQAKLLRVLQERCLRPVGGERDYETDVRVIAATNRNLKVEVEQGKFRDDLFYRLNVITIPLPALRERREDLPLLIHTFLRRLSDKAGQEADVSIASDALHILLQYSYPGNVRELENILERAYVLGGGSILAEHLADLVTSTTLPSLESGFTKETKIIEVDELNLPLNLDQVLATLEKKCIVMALEKTHGHRTKAAEMLGINLRSFRYRAQKLGL